MPHNFHVSKNISIAKTSTKNSNFPLTKKNLDYLNRRFRMHSICSSLAHLLHSQITLNAKEEKKISTHTRAKKKHDSNEIINVNIQCYNFDPNSQSLRYCLFFTISHICIMLKHSIQYACFSRYFLFFCTYCKFFVY